MSRNIYLDYAAATPLDPKVLKTMLPYFSEQFYNPSATYLSARALKNQLEAARHGVAKSLGAKPAEIIFTAGATEANNLAIQGLLQQFPDSEVLVSAIEHESVLEPAKLFSYKEIPVNEQGLIILNKLSNLISDKTVLISVMFVNNELGTIQPLSQIAKLVSETRHQRLAKGNKRPLFLHTDAAQAGNYLDLHVSRLGVDFMSLNAGKLYGPKQSGGLYIKAGIKLQPLIIGGGQEFNLRSGTENVASSIGFAKSLELAQAKRQSENQRVNDLRDNFEKQLFEKIPLASLNGHKVHRAPHISSLTFDGCDNERLMMELDERGIECAVGSACSASNDEPSHVLQAIGLSQDQARSTLRFSFGHQTTQTDLNQVVDVLAKLTAHNR
ncbi:cysteine desulfurase [Candidatus Saccharibacteria bacterium]|nr:cysteine desulfurase [Candidatus Saccharibacteria bacterium]